MAECSRCGKCCYVTTEIEGELRACRFLQKIGNQFHCRNYANRLGCVTAIVNGKVHRCMMYNDTQSEIRGCPLNIGGKPEREVIISMNWKRAEERLIHR